MEEDLDIIAEDEDDGEEENGPPAAHPAASAPSASVPAANVLAAAAAAMAAGGVAAAEKKADTSAKSAEALFALEERALELESKAVSQHSQAQMLRDRAKELMRQAEQMDWQTKVTVELAMQARKAYEREGGKGVPAFRLSVGADGVKVERVPAQPAPPPAAAVPAAGAAPAPGAAPIEAKRAALGSALLKAREKEVGKLSEATQSALQLQLGARSNPDLLRQRFILREEGFDDTLAKRGERLGLLLGTRRSKMRLQELNVIKEDQVAAAALEEDESKKKKSAIASMLAARPSADQLERQNILKHEDGEESKRKKSAIAQLLAARPSQARLEQQNILKTDGASANQMSQKRSALGGLLLSRPAPDKLLAQRIISDIGQLPAADKRAAALSQLLPKPIEKLKEVKALAAKCGWGHSAVLGANEKLYLFGSNENGRLGIDDAKQPTSSEPQAVLSSVNFVDVGDHHTAALCNGRLFTWGVGSWGRLGHGEQTDVPIPTQVSALDDVRVKTVACGAYHTLALTRTGQVYSFGWAKNGRLGIGATTQQTVSVPVMVPAVSEKEDVSIISVGAGQGVSLALDENGTLYSWGCGAWGAPGHGDESDCLAPKPVEGLKGHRITNAVAGANHCLALAATGLLFSWGQNSKHQLGRKEEKNTKAYTVPGPVEFADEKQHAKIEHTTHLAAGKVHSAIVADGAVYSWGTGTSGCLGHGNEKVTKLPTVVAALSGKQAIAVECGWNHTTVVTGDGAVLSFGDNAHGKLGF